MRKTLFLALLCLSFFTSKAQSLDFPQYQHFIQLTKAEVVQAFEEKLDYGAIVKNRASVDSMENGRNDGFRYLQAKRRFGYFILLKFYQGGIHYQLIEVPFAQTKVFQLEKQFRLMALDSTGLVSDFAIQGPKERYAYDSSCRCVYLEKKKLHKGIYVLEKGNHFLVFKQNQVNSGSEGGSYYKARFSFRRLFSRLFSWNRSRTDYSQSGFALSNQAEYKQLDSFYAKAYMLNRKGKPYTGPVDVIFTNAPNSHHHYYLKMEAKPYGPGSYGVEWLIPDTMPLDQHYSLLFIARKKTAIQEAVTFKLTNYQLKNYKLNAGQTSPNLYPNDSSFITLSALDQNEIPLTGTKVTLTYSLNGFGLAHQGRLSLPKSVQSNFYDTTFYLEPQKITYIPVTREMLPNLDARLQVEVIMVTPNNDRQHFNLSFSKADLIEEYTLEESQKSIVANYYRNEKVHVSDTVTLELIDRFFNESITLKTRLPYTISNPSRYQNIYIKDSLGLLKASISPAYRSLHIHSEKTFDSLRFSIDNDGATALFWELYYKGKRLDHGTAKQFARALQGTDPAVLLVYYPQGNQLRAQWHPIVAKTSTLQINPNFELKTYPGQELRAEYQILDFEGKPVSGANITAFAVNTQMPVMPYPSVPYLGKDKSVKLKFKTFNVQNKIGYQINASAADSAQYYQFGMDRFIHYRMYYNPEGMELYRSKSEQGVTQFQVRIMESNNFILPKEIWVDNRPAFLQVNTKHIAEPFLIEPGKHKIELRTGQYYISLDSIDMKKGEKLSLGINVHYLHNNKTARYQKVSPHYEVSELDKLDNHLLWFNPGAYGNGGYIKQGNRLFTLSERYSINRKPENNSTQSYACAGPLEEGIVEFLHPDTSFTFYYRPDQVYLQWQKLETEQKYNTLFFNLGNSISFNYFKDEDVLLPDTLLRHWFIQDSLNKLRKDIQVQKTMQVEDPQSNLFTNYAYPHYTHLHAYASLYLQDSAMSLKRMNYLWLINEDSLVYSTFTNGDPRVSLSVVPGRYKLLFGSYLKDDYIIEDLVIDTNSLHFIRLDLLKRKASKLEKQEASYSYFKTIQDYAQDKPLFFDIERAETESKGQNNKAEVNGWINQHLRASFNTYILFFSRDGKTKYLTKSNSQGYFSYFDMEPGIYYTQMITSNRQLYFAGAVELKGGQLHTFSFNCADQTVGQGEFVERFALALSEIPHSYNSSTGKKALLHALVQDEKGKALPFVAVSILDANNKQHLAISDEEGRFQVEKLPAGVYRMVVRMIGYETKSIRSIVLKTGETLTMTIVLKETVQSISEVKVQSDRGYNGITSDASPARPLNAEIQEWSNEAVVSSKDGMAKYMNATRIVGSMTLPQSFRSGVGNYELGVQSSFDEERDRLKQIRNDENANRVRDNFKTTAYWFPHLITDREGKIGFSYKNPDDETSWLHYALAIDKKRNTGLNKIYSQSYKPLSAALKVPEHVVAGDTLYFKPQMRNLTGDTIAVSTLFSIDSVTQSNQIRLGTYYRTTAYHVFNNADDSSVITYSLDYNGYKDGERRKLPVLSNKTPYRVSKTYLLDRNQSIRFSLSDSAVRRLVGVRSGIIALIQQEIEDLRRYGYGCTEQTASKLIALIRSKQLKAAIGEPFDGEQEIEMLIHRLEDFQSSSGGFGWYKNSTYDLRLTLYAAQALHLASESGYATKAHRRAAGVMINSLKMLHAEEVLSVLVLATKLDMKLDYKAEIEKYSRYNLAIQAKMTLMELRQMHKMDVDLTPILTELKSTEAGLLYMDGYSKWGFNSKILDLTLQAYRIMKAAGGHEDKLAAMRRFVFANLKNSNHNTFEKANIINTLIEEAKTNQFALFQVELGGKNYTSPFSLEAKASDLFVQNSGEQVSVIVTEEYPDLNGQEHESGVSVRTQLMNSRGQVCTQAQAGEIYRLRVYASNRESRKYVLVSVPLPSGFVVLEKPSRMSDESGREYFPDHIRIYHEQFYKGEHVYEFVLLPQFAGNFQLLPSRVEDMYDPSYHGCSGKMRIEVKD